MKCPMCAGPSNLVRRMGELNYYRCGPCGHPFTTRNVAIRVISIVDDPVDRHEAEHKEDKDA